MQRYAKGVGAKVEILISLAGLAFVLLVILLLLLLAAFGLLIYCGCYIGVGSGIFGLDYWI
jgi:hypothetical protein